MSDIQINCVDCKKLFTHTEGAQKFFDQKGFSEPKRCKDCRDKKKARHGDRD